MFLTQSKPKQTQGSDVLAGTSLDQICAQTFGQQTPIPSMQLCIENVDQAGGCSYNYSCVYTDTISWASPTEPMPMIRDPRAVFDQLFGVGTTPEARQARRRDDRSILDFVTESVDDLKRRLGRPTSARLADYLDDVREIERRIQKVEASNTSGEPRELPDAPVGVPDSFEEHVKLMFDLQAVALRRRHDPHLLVQAGRATCRTACSSRADPTTAFHTASHHLDRDERVTDFQKINTYHVSLLPHLLERLKSTPDQGGTLLDNTLVIYGSSMGNSNVHNHKRCPLSCRARRRALKGNMHVRAADGTPMANAMLADAAGTRRRDRHLWRQRRRHGPERPGVASTVEA